MIRIAGLFLFIFVFCSRLLLVSLITCPSCKTILPLHGNANPGPMGGGRREWRMMDARLPDRTALAGSTRRANDIVMMRFFYIVFRLLWFASLGKRSLHMRQGPFVGRCVVCGLACPRATRAADDLSSFLALGRRGLGYLGRIQETPHVSPSLCVCALPSALPSADACPRGAGLPCEKTACDAPLGE